MWDEELPGPIANSTITYAVNGRQYLAVYTGDGLLTSGVAAYNKELKSTRRMNTIQVFALPEDIAKQKSAAACRRGGQGQSRAERQRQIGTATLEFSSQSVSRSRDR